MLDLLVGLGLVVSLVRGYRRGFARCVIGLSLLVLAVMAGYRSGPAVGVVVESWTGAGPLAGRIAGSIVVCLAVLAIGTALTRMLIRIPAPLRPFDSIGGALVAAAQYAVVVVVLLMLVAASPLPVSGGADNVLAGSRVFRLVESERSSITPAASRLLGDRILEALVNINRVTGGSNMVLESDGWLDIPVARPQELVERPESAQELFSLINLARIEQGSGAVAWSTPLAGVAGGHGRDMYERGYFSHSSPERGSLGDRLIAAGVPFRAAGENLALAPTVATVHEGLLASPSHRETMLDPRFTRVGISALEGPTGLMVVQVFSR